MEDGVDRYKYFMRFLLEGKIIPSLKALRVRHSSLLHEPWRSCNRHITFCAFHHHTPHRHTHTITGELVWPAFVDHGANHHAAQDPGVPTNAQLQQGLQQEDPPGQAVRSSPSGSLPDFAFGPGHRSLTKTRVCRRFCSKTQPKFLLAEMKLWVNLQTHELLEQLWSKLTLDNQK
jgi:hypothetical protein